LEEHIASIFRVEEIGSENQRASILLATCLLARFYSTFFFYPKDGIDMFIRNVG
jgi:hypothetical protein